MAKSKEKEVIKPIEKPKDNGVRIIQTNNG